MDKEEAQITAAALADHDNPPLTSATVAEYGFGNLNCSDWRTRSRFRSISPTCLQALANGTRLSIGYFLT